jgi:hypothetical protein
MQLFEEACDNAPFEFFPKVKEALVFAGNTCNEILRDAIVADIGTCNSDGIREIEVLIFDMLLRKAKPFLAEEVVQAEYFGNKLRERPSGEQNQLIDRVQRNAGLIKSIDDWQTIVREQESVDRTLAGKDDYIPTSTIEVADALGIDEPFVNDDDDQYAPASILGNTDY